MDEVSFAGRSLADESGRTLEIRFDAPETQFAQRRAIFEQLMVGCRVS